MSIATQPQSSSTRVIRIADVPATRWRNGGGSTRELLAWPSADAMADPTANDWSLRLSVAEIARDGPFSAYPGVDRLFAVLSGGGVRLVWPDGRRLELTPASAPLAFDGADPPTAQLLGGGATQDLNLMLRHGRLTGCLLRALPGVAWPSAAPLRGVLSLGAARLHRQAQPSLDLPPGSLAFETPAPADLKELSWQLDGPNDLVAFWIAAAPWVPGPPT